MTTEPAPRRQALHWLAGALLGLGATLAQAQGQLNVANFSDYIGPEVVKKFEKATGIKVNYGIIDSDDTLQAKLLSGRSGYDVVYPSSNYMAKQIEAGIYEPIDAADAPAKTYQAALAAGYMALQAAAGANGPRRGELAAPTFISPSFDMAHTTIQ